jgi:hypothetical protein
MASLDLSSAFDLVYTDHLLKELRIIGASTDVINLIKFWLTKRAFFVSISGKNSFLLVLLLGTVQGSILGQYSMQYSSHQSLKYKNPMLLWMIHSNQAGIR